jgi:hypothetical protein
MNSLPKKKSAFVEEVPAKLESTASHRNRVQAGQPESLQYLHEL